MSECSFIGNHPLAVGASAYADKSVNRQDGAYSYFLRRPAYWYGDAGRVIQYTVPKGRHACRLHAFLQTFSTVPDVIVPSFVELIAITAEAGTQSFQLNRPGYNVHDFLECEIPAVLTEGDRILIKGADNSWDTFFNGPAEWLVGNFTGIEHDDASAPGRYSHILDSRHIVNSGTGYGAWTGYGPFTVPAEATAMSLNVSNLVNFATPISGTYNAVTFVWLQAQPADGYPNFAWAERYDDFARPPQIAWPVGPLSPFRDNDSYYNPVFPCTGGPGDWYYQLLIVNDGRTIEFDVELSYTTTP